MKPSIEKERKLYDALKRITMYEPPGRLRRQAEKEYGLPAGEVIEMAYENVLSEAKDAIRGMRRPGAGPRKPAAGSRQPEELGDPESVVGFE